MSSFKVSQFWVGLEVGMQLGRVILDVWREIKAEQAEKNRPTSCLNCPLIQKHSD